MPSFPLQDGAFQAFPALDFGVVLDLASALVGILNAAVDARSSLLSASQCAWENCCWHNSESHRKRGCERHRGVGNKCETSWGRVCTRSGGLVCPCTKPLAPSPLPVSPSPLACLCLNGLPFRVCIFIPMRNPSKLRPRAPPCSCLRARASSSSSNAWAIWVSLQPRTRYQAGAAQHPAVCSDVFSEKPDHYEVTSADTVCVAERASKAPSLGPAPPHPLSAMASALWSGSRPPGAGAVWLWAIRRVRCSQCCSALTPNLAGRRGRCRKSGTGREKE